MDEIVRLHALDGVWEVGGADRKRGIGIEGLNCVWDKWGPKTARFTMRRDPGMPAPDLSGFTPIEVEKHGKVGWEGFLDATPEEDEYAVSVEAIGWPDHGDNDPYQRTYVHARLGDWRDRRSFPGVTLGANAIAAGGQVDAGTGTLTCMFPDGYVAQANAQVGVVLDLGPGNTATRISYDFQTSNNNNNAPAVLFEVYGMDAPDGAGAVGLNGAPALTTIGPGPATLSHTVPAKRYLLFQVRCPGARTMAGDAWVRINGARVYATSAYESGNQSILKAHHILKDGLPFCPLWSQDTSGIDDTTSFVFPEFAMTADRPFREVADSVNALHNYVLKLGAGRRLIFRPLPSAPMFVAGPWPGVNFKDASKNSARDIYNKAVGVGVGPDGEPVKFERFAADQPGGLTPSDAVSHSNPSFDADTAGWAATRGSIARDTSTPHSAPGYLRMVSDAELVGPWLAIATTSAFAGTWRRGRLYRVRIQARRAAMELGVAFPFVVTLTVGGAVFTRNLGFADLSNSEYRPIDFLVRPAVDTTTASLELWADATSPAVTVALVDTLEVSEAVGTIPDRRGFSRSKALSISQSVNSDVMLQLADLWLQGHKRAPLKGDIEIVGRGLRRYQGGEGVDPFELGAHTSELVHLAGEIDPDTGHVGRDAPIAQVTYSGDDESAQVSLDATRENFEAVVSRYELVAGAGR